MSRTVSDCLYCDREWDLQRVTAERDAALFVLDAVRAEVDGWKANTEDTAAYWRGRVLNALSVAPKEPTP
jgi:hypothetical protein